jgi:hypothetical protein
LNAWVDILFADFLKEDAVVEHYTIQDGGRFYVAVQKMIVNERSAEFTLLKENLATLQMQKQNNSTLDPVQE